MSEYPLVKFHFQVEWGGTKIGFTEVSGLDLEIEPIEYRHGASPEYHKTKMPGMQKYSNITLKRGSLCSVHVSWVNHANLSILVLAESIYSMDGDAAELAKLIELKEKHGAWLLVDEAHAAGITGPEGRGLLAKWGLVDKVELQMGTKSMTHHNFTKRKH